MSFVNQVYQDRSDNASMHATLQQVLDDPGFNSLAPDTQEAVQSFFRNQEPLSQLLDLESDVPL